jgi:hypothetical protein
MKLDDLPPLEPSPQNSSLFNQHLNLLANASTKLVRKYVIGDRLRVRPVKEGIEIEQIKTSTPTRTYELDFYRVNPNKNEASLRHVQGLTVSVLETVLQHPVPHRSMIPNGTGHKALWVALTPVDEETIKHMGAKELATQIQAYEPVTGMQTMLYPKQQTTQETRQANMAKMEDAAIKINLKEGDGTARVEYRLYNDNSGEYNIAPTLIVNAHNPSLAHALRGEPNTEISVRGAFSASWVAEQVEKLHGKKHHIS